MNDGSVKEGYISTPSTIEDKYVYFGVEKKGKAEKLSVDNVKEIEFVYEDNSKVKYITSKVAFSAKKNETVSGGYEFNIRSKRMWLRVIEEGKLNLYCFDNNSSGGNTGVIGPSGTILPGTAGGVGTISFFLKRENQDFAFKIDEYFPGYGIKIGYFYTISSKLNKYFAADCPKLVENFKKDEFKEKGHYLILELYEQNCGK